MGNDAILPRKGPVTRAMSKRLQEDWAKAAEEGPRVLMNLRTHFFLEVASPLSLPFPFCCHLSSKKQRNPLMKKILDAWLRLGNCIWKKEDLTAAKKCLSLALDKSCIMLACIDLHILPFLPSFR
ncbi:hypothetical protein HKD37_20G055709 [Glycine soja]